MDFIDLARETKVMLATILRVGVGFLQACSATEVWSSTNAVRTKNSLLCTTIAYYKRAEKILCKTFGEYLSLFLKLANLRYQNR